MTEIPRNITDAIYQRVLADLEPSMPVIYGKVGVSILVGGVLSLLVCGQFGVGATSIALEFNENLHTMNGGMMCAIYCGAIFALIPLAILRIQCSLLQFNVIVKDNYHAVAVWLGSFGAMLSYHGNIGAEVLSFFVWFASAALVFKLGSMLVPSIDKILDSAYFKSQA